VILTIDIGNTQTVFGLFADGELILTCRLATRADRPASETTAWLAAELTGVRADPARISRSILSSVVPDAIPAIADTVRHLTGRNLILAGRDNIGLTLLVNHPETVGIDRLVDTLAASRRYACPLIVIDLGTASTISVLDAEGCFIGGAIGAGLQTTANSLNRAAAQLPALDLPALARETDGQEMQIPAIGTDTAGCLRSGIILGAAAMLEGLVDRIEEELGQTASRIITGGYASLILPFCRRNLSYEPNLLLLGLHDLAARSEKL
jgi:type III pantothenate kinase